MADGDPIGDGERDTVDGDLVEAVRRRDPAAMEALYDRYGRRAFGLAYRVLGDGTAAEEAVQDAFVAIWRQSDRLDPARGRLGSYLMTVVHRRSIDILRARSRANARNLPFNPEYHGGVTGDLLDDVVARQDSRELRSCVEQLPGEQRQVIEKAYFEGLTHSAIAGELGLAPGTVKSRLRLGLQKLRASLHAEVQS